MVAGSFCSSGPKKQSSISATTNHSPAMAILFLASRCHASRQSELAGPARLCCSASTTSCNEVSAGISLKSQSRVQPDLHDVHDQIEKYNQCRVKNDRAANQRVIAIGHRRDEKAAQAW